jgi:hypothetical protein
MGQILDKKCKKVPKQAFLAVLAFFCPKTLKNPFFPCFLKISEKFL